MNVALPRLHAADLLSPRARYRAVLFDFFGTLTTACHRGPRHSWIAASLGCDPRAFVDALDRTFYQRASGAYGTPRDALAQIAFATGGRPSRAQLDAAVHARVGAVAADVRLRPEAVAVLEGLRRRGLRTALVSDCWYELPRFLRTLPIAPLIDATAFSIEVGRCKPDPAMYLTACEGLGVTPDECLYVGDGGSQELTGARSVGMDAVQLDADDLAGHLRFTLDPGWVGPAISSLGEVAAMTQGLPVPV
jgi:putative hydrolase of the HAD superfamily